MNKINLFADKKDCCACNACFNACPKNAIEMKEDEYGYLYPYINDALCVECGLCNKVCNFKNKVTDNYPIEAYAAMSRNDELLKKSASGGVFASLAYEFIKNDGIVYGCCMEKINNNLKTHHIRINKLNDINKIQGSKYVKSDIENTFKFVKKDLLDNKLVMFTGTPCQIDGLYGYLGNKKFSNLFTIDLICHGVPNEKILKEYINLVQKRLKCSVDNILFRDKSNGWSLKGNIIYSNINGKQFKKVMPLQGFSYYKMFLDSILYRENCYSCKYASTNRVGDITIGDFWGIENEHPELLEINGGLLSENKGISCILVNSLQGSKLIEKYSSLLILNKSNVESIKKINFQLQSPSKRPEIRDSYLELFKNNGYKYLENHYYKRFGLKSILYKLWNYLPGKPLSK